MSLGYFLIILSQVFILAVPTAISFNYRKRRYIVFSFLFYLAFVFGTELLGMPPYKSTALFVFFCSVEMLLPYIFSRFFLNNLPWKSAVIYTIIGMAVNLITTIIVRVIPITSRSMLHYMAYEEGEVELFGGVLIFVIYAIVAFGISVLFRKLISRDKQSLEVFYKIIYLLYYIICMVAAVFTKTDADYLSSGISYFYFIVLPILFISEGLVIIAATIFHQHHHIASVYRSIQLEKKEERGDSNKEIKIFTEGSIINDYLNKRLGEYKSQGVAVDVISYLSDRISLPVDEKEFIIEMDRIFENYELSRTRAPMYLVLGFKMNKEGVIIHIEYNLRERGQLISKLLERETISIMKSHYRLERQGLLNREILLLYPNK